MSENIAIIPVRKGSKRVKKKNIRNFRGQPLLVWSIKAAIYSSKIDKIIISTDDEEAAEIAQDYSVEVLMRPKKLASDTASTFDVLNYVFCTQLKDNDISPQTVVLLQATSPLRENDLIDKGMKKFQQEKDADRLIELNQLKLFTGSIKSGEWVADFPEDTRSQELPAISYPSGRLYIYNYKTTIAIGQSEGSKTSFLLADPEKNINIDYESDFEKLEYVFSQNTSKYNYLLQ